MKFEMTEIQHKLAIEIRPHQIIVVHCTVEQGKTLVQQYSVAEMPDLAMFHDFTVISEATLAGVLKAQTGELSLGQEQAEQVAEVLKSPAEEFVQSPELLHACQSASQAFVDHCQNTAESELPLTSEMARTFAKDLLAYLASSEAVKEAANNSLKRALLSSTVDCCLLVPNAQLKRISIDAEIASGPPEQLNEQAELYIPFDLEDAEIDWQRCETQAEETSVNYTLMSAQRSSYEDLQEALRLAELPHARLAGYYRGLAHAAVKADSRCANGFAAILYVGRYRSCLVLLENGELHNGREIASGLDNYAVDLRMALDLSSDDALKTVQDLIAGAEISDDLRDALIESHKNLANEVALTLSYLTTLTDIGGSMTLSLTGEGSQIPGLKTALSTMTECAEVNRLDLSPIVPEALTPELKEHFLIHGAIAVGNCLR